MQLEEHEQVGSKKLLAYLSSQYQEYESQIVEKREKQNSVEGIKGELTDKVYNDVEAAKNEISGTTEGIERDSLY